MNIIEDIHLAQQHIIDVFSEEDSLDLAVDYYYPKCKHSKRLRNAMKAKILSNPGWLGNFLELFAFDREHDNKAERDLPCAEVKTIQLQKTYSGKSFSFRSLSITKANRLDLAKKEFDSHFALQSKSSDMLVAYFHKHQLLRVGIIQPRGSEYEQAFSDYDQLASYASNSSDFQFNHQSWKTSKESILTLTSKKANGKRGKAISFTSPVIRNCFYENSICA